MLSQPVQTRTQGASRKLLSTILWGVGILCAAVLVVRYLSGSTIQEKTEAASALQKKTDLEASAQITPAALASKAETQSVEARARQAKQDANEVVGTGGSAAGAPVSGSAQPGKGTEPLRMPKGTPPGSPAASTPATAGGADAAVAEETAKAANVRNQAGASKIVAYEDSSATGVDTADGRLSSGAPQPLSLAALDSQLQQVRTMAPGADLSGLLKAAQAPQSGARPASPAALGANATPGQRNQDWLAQQDAQGQQDQAPLTPTPAPSEYLLAEGTPIPIVLLGDVTSDLPGRLSAMVTRDVFDSIVQRYPLIPAGTKLTGTYNSEVSPGQRRILMALSRMRFPNGASVRLGGMSATDANGASGAEAKVDNHFLEMFGASLVIGAVSLAAAPANASSTNVTINVGGNGNGNPVAAMGTQVLADTVKRILDRNTNLKPTLTLGKGERLMLITTRDMVLPPSVTGGRRSN